MAFIPAVAEIGAEAGVGAEATAEEVGTSAADAAVSEEGEGAPHGEHDLGHGNSMSMSPEQFQALMHSSAAVAAIMDRAQHCADIANSLAITKGAKYAVKLQNKPDHTRARAAVYAANFKAVVDELNHSTLLKAAAQTGSDPRQTAESHEGEEPEEEEESPSEGEGEGESTIADAAMGEEL